MSFQGHIENGVVVFDEPVPLPAGTVVCVEPAPIPKQMPDVGEPVADTDRPYTVQQMAHAWKTVSRPIPEDHVRLSVDPDDYPLF